jgi:hypothetical protein
MPPSMSRFEQYEVWEFNHGRWELVAAFQDFDLANVMARRRTYRVRLMRITYDDGKAVQQEVLAEIGETREEP